MLVSQDFGLFERWAAHVEELMGATWQPDVDTEMVLAHYYRNVLQRGHRRPEFTATLTRVTDWVADVARQDEVVASWDIPVRELVALAAAHSTWMSGGDDRSVTSIVDDWMLLNRDRFQVECNIAMQDVVADPKTAAALLKVLQECASELSRLPAPRVILKDRRSPEGYTLVIGCQGHSFSQLNGSTLIRLLCEAAPRLSVHVPERDAIGLNVKDGPRSIRKNWLTAAAFGEQADDYDVELARLIHDLKNEVTAARVALERPVSSRTEGLEAKLASSRHMDAAAVLASRLRDADMLYTAADLVGSTDLATFMRSYISDQIRRFPASIRILPPALTPAVVAIEEHALRAVLDNLIRNAEEALDEGEISLEYSAFPAEEVVLIELTDSGRGIPDEVIEAFAVGRPIASTKREGSGLGLLGVRRVLRRAGGDLEPLQDERGTAWVITLPLVPFSDSIGASGA
jgi:signal transduction histidine kinase